MRPRRFLILLALVLNSTADTSAFMDTSDPSEATSPAGTASSDAPNTDQTSTTTADPSCSIECPDGYLIGTSSCYIMYPSSRASSYQSSLSLCMATDRQTLVSLDKLRDRSDIELVQTAAAQNQMNWFFANGIGSKMERMDKLAEVYSIFDQTLVSAPVVTTVKVSARFSNISTLCVIPKYCDAPSCNLENLLLTFDYYTPFKSSATFLEYKETASLTCLYSKQETTVTCGALGSIYPEPSLIDCKRENDAQIMTDTTNDTVSSCSRCFKRGTEACIPVSDDTGNTVGFKCECKEPYMMAECAYTPDKCTKGYCGDHGTCKSIIDELSCECELGYTGDICEINLKTKFSKKLGAASFSGLILVIGAILLRVVRAILGLMRADSRQNDDPQSTHQQLRSYCIFVAGALVLLFSNPTLFGITQSACRFDFIVIHFSFLMAMVQWLLEAWNVNQVLRCVHLNEWERNWEGHRSWGVRIAPRMILSCVAVSAALLITFQAGWNQLAAGWTCVGVICQSTISVWIPLFGMVICILLHAGAICESSILIKFRRPLLGYRMSVRTERELGHMQGKHVDKCRRNEMLCISGLLILVLLWFLIILSSDYKDDDVIGLGTAFVALVYSVFSFYQETVTSPEDLSMWTRYFQKCLPLRFAPVYDHVSMWSVDEVKQMYLLPAAERKARYQSFMSHNQFLHLHHRWDLRFNELLADRQTTINEALVKVFSEEMHRLRERNGTIEQKNYLQHAYKDFLLSIPDNDPRTESGRVQAKLELVTLAAETPIGVKLAKFFIVPGFDVFQPEIPHKDDLDVDRNIRQHQRLLNERIQMEYYRVMRQEAHAQAVFVNSNIHFYYFGNEVIR